MINPVLEVQTLEGRCAVQLMKDLDLCDTEVVITDELYYAKAYDRSRMYSALNRFHPIYVHLGTMR